MTELGETGESEPVSFDTYGTHSNCCKTISCLLSYNLFKAPSPPIEVVATGLNRSFLVGENLTVDMECVGHPVTVNAVDRELFHYKSDTHSLHRTTLDSSISEVRRLLTLNQWSFFSMINTTFFIYSSQVVANLPSDLIPFALSYDWLGMTIYLAGKNSTDIDGSFGIWKFPLATELLHHLFSKTSDDEVQVTMVMNPFTGYVRLFHHTGICSSTTCMLFNFFLQPPVLDRARCHR